MLKQAKACFTSMIIAQREAELQNNIYQTGKRVGLMWHV